MSDPGLPIARRTARRWGGSVRLRLGAILLSLWGWISGQFSFGEMNAWADPGATIVGPDSPSSGSDQVGPVGFGLEEQLRHVIAVLAAENGTDPTAIIGRFQLGYQYEDFPDGAYRIRTVPRIDIPLAPNWVLRLDLPIQWGDEEHHDDRQSFGIARDAGLSDLQTRIGWRAYRSSRFAFILGADFIFPTATSTELGRGKYDVGPAAATAMTLPSIHSNLFTILQHFTSVGGDPSRPDTERTKAQVRFNTVWTKEWWTDVEPILNVDWSRGGKTGMVLEAEVGRRLDNHWRAWGRVGGGLWGRDVRGNYEWSLEFGARYMFYVF